MAFKRPSAGDPVTVEDFGQPVYDLVTANLIYGLAQADSTPLTVINVDTTIKLRNGRSIGITVDGTGMTLITPGVYLVGLSLTIGGLSGGSFVGVKAKLAGTEFLNFVNSPGGYWLGLSGTSMIYSSTPNARLTFTAGTDSGTASVVQNYSTFSARFVSST